MLSSRDGANPHRQVMPIRTHAGGRHSLRPWARVAILATACLSLSACALSRQILYSPDPPPTHTTNWIADRPERVHLPTQDGRLTGYFWPGASGKHDIIIFFHGRNWSAVRSAQFAQYLAGTGNAVLVASYHGFSGNPGRPSQDGMLRDAAAFIDLAVAHSGPQARIWLIGHSIGAAVALHAAAADPRVDGVIAMNAFARVAAAAPRITRALIPDRWDNLEALKSVHKPVIFMQGGLDRFVPERGGDELFSAYDGPASLIVGESARHNPDMKTLGPWLTAAIDAMQDGSLATLPPLPAGWIEKVRRP